MNIEIINEKMQKVTPSTTSKWITSYQDTDDIMNYSASQLLYTPMSIDIENTYREITKAKHESYLKDQEEAIKILEQE